VTSLGSGSEGRESRAVMSEQFRAGACRASNGHVTT
jgi:hypothetical protein